MSAFICLGYECRRVLRSASGILTWFSLGGLSLVFLGLVMAQIPVTSSIRLASFLAIFLLLIMMPTALMLWRIDAESGWLTHWRLASLAQQRLRFSLRALALAGVMMLCAPLLHMLMWATISSATVRQMVSSFLLLLAYIGSWGLLVLGASFLWHFISLLTVSLRSGHGILGLLTLPLMIPHFLAFAECLHHLGTNTLANIVPALSLLAGVTLLTLVYTIFFTPFALRQAG